jgi:hypothetical protein
MAFALQLMLNASFLFEPPRKAETADRCRWPGLLRVRNSYILVSGKSKPKRKGQRKREKKKERGKNPSAKGK